jgi:hypothetical protein
MISFLVGLVIGALVGFGLGIWYTKKNQASTSAVVDAAKTVVTDVKK